MNVYMNFPRIGSSASSSSGRDMPPLKGSQGLNMDPASRYQPPTSCDVQKEVESKVGDAPSSRKGCLNFRTGVGSPGTKRAGYEFEILTSRVRRCISETDAVSQVG